MGHSFGALIGFSLRGYFAHLGSFSIRSKGCNCIGATTNSGLPEREDHTR
ncbi:heme-binding protein [Pseudomonas amygdali]|nr:heme-binding protein [Pseudomonas amygdali]